MAGRARIAFAGTILAWLVLPVPQATAGGGCHLGVTHGSGDTVEMVDACFTPTILEVSPGSEVTFVNRDEMVHNVTANQWGHFDDMAAGDAFTATFDAAGIYPFACTYHPGMSGAVVVGDGAGAGNGEAVTVEPLEIPEADAVEPAAEPVLAQRPATDDPASAPPWGLAGALGLAVGAGIGIAAGRRRRVEG